MKLQIMGIITKYNVSDVSVDGIENDYTWHLVRGTKYKAERNYCEINHELHLTINKRAYVVYV